MPEPANLRNLVWGLTTLTEVALFVYLLKRRIHKSHPAFVVYILAAILQSIAVFSVYQLWEFHTKSAWKFAWGSQGVVVCARWAAVIEVVRTFFSGYAGIWALVRRVLTAVSLLVLLYSAFFSDWSWYLLVLVLGRALEFSVAALVVTSLLFARYYGLPLRPFDRRLSVGFCLYSCFWVFNYSLVERWLGSYREFWSFLEVVAFFASLLLWIAAVRMYSPAPEVQLDSALPPELYGRASSELNSRLRLLNEQLNHLRRSRHQRS